MKIYQGIPGRGGALYGEQASYTLMKAAGDEEAVQEPDTMEPEPEIPTDEPTEPEPIVEAEVEPEAHPEEAEEEEEVPLDEPELVVAAEEEFVAEPEPEPEVEEEPVIVEEEVPPPPEPEPEETGVKFVFNPETPYLTDGSEPIIVSGEVSGIVEPTTTRFYLSVVRKGENGTTYPVADAPLNPEGARTTTSHSLVNSLQVF